MYTNWSVGVYFKVYSVYGSKYKEKFMSLSAINKIELRKIWRMCELCGWIQQGMYFFSHQFSDTKVAIVWNC